MKGESEEDYIHVLDGTKWGERGQRRGGGGGEGGAKDDGTKKDRKRRGRFGLIVVVFNVGQGGERVYDVWMKQSGEGVEESEREAASKQVNKQASKQASKQARAT